MRAKRLVAVFFLRSLQLYVLKLLRLPLGVDRRKSQHERCAFRHPRTFIY
jgi:hypothetical protein